MSTQRLNDSIRRKDVRVSCRVLFQDVILRSATQRGSRYSTCLSSGNVHREHRGGPVALIVMLAETCSIGSPSTRVSIFSSVLIATPTFPTSPWALGLSESSPSCVGRSKATLRPDCPAFIRYLNRLLVSEAFPNPEYCLIVHSFWRYISRINSTSVRKRSRLAQQSTVVSLSIFGGVDSFRRECSNLS